MESVAPNSGMLHSHSGAESATLEQIGARLYPQAMTDDAERLQRLAAYIERRIAELGLEYAEVARLADFSIEVLRKMRHGTKVRPSTHRKLERALQWTRESVDAILSGGEPTALPQSAAAEPSTDRRATSGETTGGRTSELSPGEALRRVVRASARELGVAGDELDEVFQAVRDDLDEAPPTRTDLSDLVRLRRAEAGLSLEAVAALTADRSSGGRRLVEADWLGRLERAELAADEHPEYPQLDALADALGLDPGAVQEAAGVQFMDVHTVWSEDGQVRAVVTGELSSEDLAKVHNLMRLYGRAPKR